jgi:hypothetical protein
VARKPRKGLRFAPVLLLLAGVAALLVWFLGRAPVPEPKAFPVETYPAPVQYSGDPAADTARLLATLNRRLAQMDLLKLLDREVETFKVRVRNREVAAYRETFRLPARYTPGWLAAQLREAARDAGAQPLRFEQRSDGGAQETHYSCSFGFSSEWTPVEIVFAETSRPRVCLIVDDGGYRRGEVLRKLYALGVPLTLAVIPGLEFSPEIARTAPFQGVEVLCHLPMEGSEPVKKGAYPFFLQRGMPPRAVERIVREAVAGVPVCRGLNNHMGSLATEDTDLMLQVCSVLKAEGLFFVDSKTSLNSAAARTAASVRMPYAERDVFLDNETDEAYIRGQFETLLAKARRKGVAVGIGHLHEATLNALAAAIPGARERGFRFVFASEVVR